MERAQRLLEGPGFRGEIEGIEGLGDIEIAVGVETLDEGFALVGQVCLHGKRRRELVPARVWRSSRPNLAVMPASDR